MKKIMGLLCGVILFSGSLTAQTKDKIDKAIKDPKREENAAKADVQIFKSKKISDTTIAVDSQNATSKKSGKKKSKKKSN